MNGATEKPTFAEIKANMPPDSTVFEFPEQQGLSLGQRHRAQSYMHITQLLQKVLILLDDFTIQKVTADKVCEGDLSLFQQVRDSEKRWRDIFVEAAKHHEKCVEIMSADIKLAQSRAAFLASMKHLPDDSILINRVKELTATLDGLEKHRASGLLDAIAKL